MRLKLRIKKAVSLDIELNSIHQAREWHYENWYTFVLSRKTGVENPPDNGFLPDNRDIIYYQVSFTTPKNDLVLHRFSSFRRESLERFIELQQHIFLGNRCMLDEWFEQHPAYHRLMNDGMVEDIQDNPQLADQFGTMFFNFNADDIRWR